jgi:hypothetical protein
MKDEDIERDKTEVHEYLEGVLYREEFGAGVMVVR